MAHRPAPTSDPLQRLMRWLTIVRRTITIGVLPPRRSTPAERRAIRDRIASDPTVDRTVREFLDAEPEFNPDESATTVRGRGSR